MSNLLKRTISGIIFGAVMIAGTAWNEGSFAVLYLLIHFFVFREYLKLVFDRNGVPFPSYLLMAAGLVISGSFALIPYLAMFAYVLFALFVFLIIGFLIAVFVFHPENAFRIFAKSVVGFVMISIPLTIVFLPQWCLPEINYAHLLLVALFYTWINDTFAYFTGSLIGKHAFAPVLSPKKTWEGVAGGILFTLGFAFAVNYFVPEYGLQFWLGAAFLTSLAAILGDLLESALKRSLGVKDSGKFLPGHGGFLDRFDAFLVVIPFITLYYFIFQLTYFS